MRQQLLDESSNCSANVEIPDVVGLDTTSCHTLRQLLITMPLSALTQRPKKRSKTHDREHKLCAKCSAFFISTSLKELSSPSGLRHKSRAELREIGDACLLCAYIYFSATKYAGNGWQDSEYLTFRNFHDLFKPPEADLLGVYGLKCFLESDRDNALFSIQAFAKAGMCSLTYKSVLCR